MSKRVLEIRKSVLGKNDLLAAELRTRFQAAGVTVFNLVSGPGAGKTALLERTLRTLMREGRRAAALTGDLETGNDARRLEASGATVRQIMTHGCCHLDAEMISTHIEGWDLAAFDVLFIENVGNLVCPASYDLGEDSRVALLSVTEGEDKPLKYPGIFHSADAAVLTKMDLAAACEFDLEAAAGNLRAVHPAIRIIETSAKTGMGMREWMDFLLEPRERLP